LNDDCRMLLWSIYQWREHSQRLYIAPHGPTEAVVWQLGYSLPIWNTQDLSDDDFPLWQHKLTLRIQYKPYSHVASIQRLPVQPTPVAANLVAASSLCGGTENHLCGFRESEWIIWRTWKQLWADCIAGGCPSQRWQPGCISPGPTGTEHRVSRLIWSSVYMIYAH
jgi:hypothetical protein